MNNKAKSVALIGMLSAISYVVVFICHNIGLRIVPAVSFLTYDAKDVIIAMGGFMFGPLTSLAISFIVSFIEMFTISNTGIIGLIMNIVSSCTFACVAAIIYKRKRCIKNAIIGLVTGVLVATAAMMLWNYLITPWYMGTPREVVAGLLIPGFLPFNLIKYGVNAAFTMVLYKPVVRGLRKAHILDAR